MRGSGPGASSDVRSEEMGADGSEDRPASLPIRRLIELLRPIRAGLVAMIGLDTTSALVGLVPPLALGTFVGALVERKDVTEGVLLAGLMGLAMCVEATANFLSEGIYTRNASRLYGNLRMQMFEGARRLSTVDEHEIGGLPSRFISDAESVGVAVLVLDIGAMLLVEFAAATVALGLLAPWTVPVVAPALAATWIVTRRTQEPVASASQNRQEELEAMTKSVTSELAHRDDPQSVRRFSEAVGRVRTAEVRVGWLEALNLQGSGGLAKLGPVAAVVAAAFTGTNQVGTLISLYLIAQRVFFGFDGMVDLSLDLNSVRGAVARCFALVDTPTPATEGEQLPPATDL
jgi:ABC-type multidrug transport system fused ATPase/permease subunit